jgi:hypothetical protein
MPRRANRDASNGVNCLMMKSTFDIVEYSTTLKANLGRAHRTHLPDP